MLRIIIEESDAGMAANIGGPVYTTFRTFDVELPDVEEYLADRQSFRQRMVRGVEIIGRDDD